MGFRQIRRFIHDETGRKVLAFDDGEAGWIVEAREGGDSLDRRRWFPATAAEAEAIALWLVGDGKGWRDES